MKGVDHPFKKHAEVVSDRPGEPTKYGMKLEINRQKKYYLPSENCFYGKQ